MTEIIATFKVNSLDNKPKEDIEYILMDIADMNNLDLISWGTI